MLKVSSKERGEAAEKRELAKLNLIKLSKAEIKKLNEIVHNKELVKETKKYKRKVIVERNNNSVGNFYCCGSFWPDGIQCFVCNYSFDL